MAKWNDTDEPLAFLITFRTYGTWLHGDTRGSTDRYHNLYGTPHCDSRIVREQQQVVKLKSEPFIMDCTTRSLVEEAVRETCRYRDWHLYTINVRTNHAHVVVGRGAIADKILNDLRLTPQGYCERVANGIILTVLGPTKVAKYICGLMKRS